MGGRVYLVLKNDTHRHQFCILETVDWRVHMYRHVQVLIASLLMENKRRAS